jgi:uncharacterized integral membrane protein (TIGR00698 family)
MNQFAIPLPSDPTHPSRWHRFSQPSLLQLLPGVGLSALLAAAAIQLGSIDWLQAHGMSALTAAIAIGLVVGNTLYARIAGATGAGVTFSKQTLLRAGVILYGLRLTLHDMSQVGMAGVVIDALVLTSTFLIAVWLGTRVFGLERETAMLIGAGSAICGAAAVMATEPVIRAKADHVTIAISTVVLFGTVAMFAYPALYALIPHGSLAASARSFGVYTGSTIHEVAQVFAAGRSVSDSVANTAVITKMVRVMMLAPFLIVLSAWIGRGARPLAVGRRAPAISIPWFAVAFVGVVLFNSLALLSPRTLELATKLDTLLLAMAMVALGLTTQISALRRAGTKPLILGAVMFVWLVVGGGAINGLVTAWLHP